jgi:hypothetical protein
MPQAYLVVREDLQVRALSSGHAVSLGTADYLGVTSARLAGVNKGVDAASHLRWLQVTGHEM